MRDAVVLVVWWVASVLSWVLSWRPSPTPQSPRWTVGSGQRVGWAVFSPLPSWASRWHVWAVLEDEGALWVFDPGEGQVGVALLGFGPDQIETFFRRMGVAYAVEVRGEAPARTFVATPVSCATLTQTALGLRVPHAYTADRLLAWLDQRRADSGESKT